MAGPERKPSGRERLVHALVGAGLWGALAGVGYVQGRLADPSEVVYVTDHLGFHPRQAPVLNALKLVVEVLAVIGGAYLGLGLVILSFRRGYFWLFGGLVLGGLGLLSLVVFGLGLIGQMDFDLGQKIVFAVIAVMCGGMGGVMVVQDLRLRLRKRRR